MNGQQVKRKVVRKRIIGVIIGVPAFISTVISLLKTIYIRIDDGTDLGGILFQPLKSMVLTIHEFTDRFIGFLWEYSPTLDLVNLAKIENVFFLVIYILMFLGAAFFASGNELALRLQKIRQIEENKDIEDSTKRHEGGIRKQVVRETEIPDSGVFSQIHELYVAPIVVGIIVGVLLKFVGVI